MVVRLEIWRRAVREMRRLGVDAKIEIADEGVRVSATDGTKLIDQTIPATAVDIDAEDIVLEQLMKAVDALIHGPLLTLIDGGKSKRD